MPARKNLGSLSQSARKKQLRLARGILLFVGVLTVAVNAYFVIKADDLVRNLGIPQQFHAEAVRTLQLYNGIALVLGIVFIILGIIVYQFPVPVTITGLVLYVGAAAVFGMIDPSTLKNGILVKILIVAGLASAIKAAIAYEKEQKQQARPSYGGGSIGPPGANY